MANFQLAPKLTVINSKEALQLAFFKLVAGAGYNLVEATEATAQEDADNYDPIVAGASVIAAEIMRIHGYADFTKNKIISVIAHRAVPAQKEVSTLTLTTTGAVAGKEFTLKVKQSAVGTLPAELAQYDSEDYSRVKNYQFLLAAGETAAALAGRLKTAIMDDDFGITFRLFDVTVAAGVLTFTAKETGISIKAWIEPVNIADAGMVTAVQAYTTPAFPGRGTYDQLKTWRLETDANSTAYATNRGELPLKDAKYASIMIKQAVERPDLSGPSTPNEGPVSGIHSYHLYVNEALTTEITSILDWLHASAATSKVYVASKTPAQVLTVPEATVATVALFVA